MEPFLHSVAHRIWDEHRQDLDRILVVFNNRRAGLFLQKQMLALSDKPFFLPRIVGIDDLIAQLGNIKIAPHEFLLFELFDIETAVADANLVTRRELMLRHGFAPLNSEWWHFTMENEPYPDAYFTFPVA